MTAARGFPHLPALPLANAVDRALLRREPTKQELDSVLKYWIGISDRTLREWRNLERKATQFNVADRVLCGLRLNWWEVWNETTVPDPEVLASVRYAFTGERDGEQLELVA